MAERPFLDEAIRIMRERRDLDDIPDVLIAQMISTRWIELGLAAQALNANVSTYLPLSVERRRELAQRWRQWSKR